MLQQEVFTLPMESFLYIEGTLSKKTGSADTTNVKMVNNAIAFLFEEIRYELAGVEVVRTKSVGIASTIKTMLSVGAEDVVSMKNAGWVAAAAKEITLPGKNGEFNFCIPLRMLMGFAEDFTHVILNMKQELILLRTSTDVNALFSSTDTPANADIELTKISGMIPLVYVNNEVKIRLLDVVR